MPLQLPFAGAHPFSSALYLGKYTAASVARDALNSAGQPMSTTVVSFALEVRVASSKGGYAMPFPKNWEVNLHLSGLDNVCTYVLG